MGVPSVAMPSSFAASSQAFLLEIRVWVFFGQMPFHLRAGLPSVQTLLAGGTGAVGVAVGSAVGVSVGVPAGAAVGDTVGAAVGDTVGSAVGVTVGSAVTVGVGSAVGVAVGVAVGFAV